MLIVSLVNILAVVLVISLFVGFRYNLVIDDNEETKVIAHRCGGSMASENSLEGINKAIENECSGAETDIQRTKDGYYIINHDSDFGRLTGVKKTPKEMTLAQIKELRIKDTTGNGTVEELNCDIIMVEEEMLSRPLVRDVHQAGKVIAVWTANHNEGIRSAMVIGADYIITDEVEKALETRKLLEERTDLEMLLDTFDIQ